MIGSKKKGNRGEQKLAAWMRENGIKAWKDSASGAGSGDKGDINNSLDLTIEVKTVKKINLRKAWNQVNHAASMHHNSPLLAIHLDGMLENQWLMVISSDDWVELLKNSTPAKPQQAPGDDWSGSKGRVALWAIERARSELKKALKELEI